MNYIIKPNWMQVRELEGQDMREVIQDRVNAWFVENRNDATGEYPDFPDQDEGGSKVCAFVLHDRGRRQLMI